MEFVYEGKSGGFMVFLKIKNAIKYVLTLFILPLLLQADITTQRTESGLIIEVRLDDLQIDTTSITNKQYVAINASNTSFAGNIGEPALPIRLCVDRIPRSHRCCGLPFHRMGPIRHRRVPADLRLQVDGRRQT